MTTAVTVYGVLSAVYKFRLAKDGNTPGGVDSGVGIVDLLNCTLLDQTYIYTYMSVAYQTAPHHASFCVSLDTARLMYSKKFVMSSGKQ